MYMKLLKLEKGEPAYLLIPNECTVSIDQTTTRQKGMKFILVRAI